jgi:hypothetical protein
MGNEAFAFAPSPNWVCQQFWQTSIRRSSARSSESNVWSGCLSAKGWLHASQAVARNWMFHSFMYFTFKHGSARCKNKKSQSWR